MKNETIIIMCVLPNTKEDMMKIRLDPSLNLIVYSTTWFPFIPAAVWIHTRLHGETMGRAWRLITALCASVHSAWILTLSHGLEVQFATVASKPSYGSGPDLEHVDASWLEAADDHCVGLAPDGGGVIFWLVLGEGK